MVNRAVVLETIKKMYDSGVEDSVVRQTLKDIGLSDREISLYIAEVKGEAPPAQSPAAEEAAGAVTEKEAIKKHLEERREAEEAMHTTTHAALESQNSKLAEVKEKLGVCEAKLAQLSSKPGGKDLEEKITALNHRIAALERQVGDLQALNKALHTVMQKILETDRKVLNKL